MSTALIRVEQFRDRASVRRVNETAFGGQAEADLVEALHRAGSAVVALVAELNGEVVAHILFSTVSLEPSTPTNLVGLGPMAVSPDFQKRGIGTLLIREGLRRSGAAGAEAVVVLGHAEYYPRFGFQPAHAFGLRCEYDVPPDVFMVLELVPGSLGALSGGLVRYHEAFSDVSRTHESRG